MHQIVRLSEQRKSDKLFGNQKEEEAFVVLKRVLGISNLMRCNKWFVMDFKSDDCYIELKGRRCSSTQYKDTMVGKNKVDYADTCGKDVYFCFSFSDGLFYWKYDREEIGRNVRFGRGGRNDRGAPEFKEYAFINTSLLTKIDG